MLLFILADQRSRAWADLGAQFGIERRDAPLIELVGGAGLAEPASSGRAEASAVWRDCFEQRQPLLGGERRRM